MSSHTWLHVWPIVVIKLYSIESLSAPMILTGAPETYTRILDQFICLLRVGFIEIMAMYSPAGSLLYTKTTWGTRSLRESRRSMDQRTRTRTSITSWTASRRGITWQSSGWMARGRAATSISQSSRLCWKVGARRILSVCILYDFPVLWLQSCPRVGWTHGSGRAGSGHDFAGFWRVGSGQPFRFSRFLLIISWFLEF